MEPNFVPRDSLDMDSHQVSAGFVERLMSQVLILYAAQYHSEPGLAFAESLCGCPVLGREAPLCKLC